MTVNIDTNTGHDHTYYGRGCKNTWGTDGLGGSATPCPDSDAGGRYVTTADGEMQKNGTNMNYQAATAGSGATTTTNNADSPDTFCPLGWQLPYSGTGGDYYNKSRSWNYLFTTYSIAFTDGTTPGGTTADATKIKSYPFSYVYSGYFHWVSGRLYQQSTNGGYWSSIAASDTRAYGMYTWVSNIRVPDAITKYSGYMLRCDFDISNLESSPWHPRKTLNILGFIKLLNEPEME